MTGPMLAEWEQELASQEEFFTSLGPTLPHTLELQRQMLLESVRTARKASA